MSRYRSPEPCPVCNDGRRTTTKGRPRVKQTIPNTGWVNSSYGSEKPIRLYGLEHHPSVSAYPYRPGWGGLNRTYWVCPACRKRRNKQPPAEPEVREWMKPKPGREERAKAKARKHKMRQSKGQK